MYIVIQKRISYLFLTVEHIALYVYIYIYIYIHTYIHIYTITLYGNLPPKNNTILTADKGMVMVCMDQQDYSNRCQDILADKETYSHIMEDLTTKHKTTLSMFLGLLRLKVDQNLQTWHLPSGPLFAAWYGHL